MPTEPTQTPAKRRAYRIACVVNLDGYTITSYQDTREEGGQIELRRGNRLDRPDPDHRLSLTGAVPIEILTYWARKDAKRIAESLDLINPEILESIHKTR